MLNTSRIVKTLVFNLNAPLIIGDSELKPGFNYIQQSDNGQYDVFHFSDMKDSYVYILEDEMPAVLHQVFPHLLYPEQAGEKIDIPYHIHQKKTKLRKVA